MEPNSIPSSTPVKIDLATELRDIATAVSKVERRKERFTKGVTECDRELAGLKTRLLKVQAA